MGQTASIIEDVKKALRTPNDEIAKSITQGTGLVAFDLQAPSKNLYPVLTPIRNRLPRVPGNGGTAINWRQVSAIVGSGHPGSGWVPEGQRAARMSYTTANKSATYETIGEEDQASFESVSAGQGFEDIQANMTMRLLQQCMLKEENALLLGNASTALGTPTTPTLSAAGSGATLPANTYSVIVVALTGEGMRNASLANGVPNTTSFTGADGNTITINGGRSNKSAAGSQAITLGQTLSCSVTPITGALGYAWFVGTAGAERLEAITTINSVTFSAALNGTRQLASAVTAADQSRNQSIAFDGLIYSALLSGSGAYVNTLATGTPGVGTVLTSSGRGTVNEIDTMFQAMWDLYQVSPTVLYLNSQELKNLSNKVMSSGSSPLLQIFADPQTGYANMQAGGVVGWYFNPFTAGGGVRVPIKIHPAIPAGTIIGWAEDLPLQYQSNNVPNVAEVKVRRDYYQLNWPLRTRQYEVGVYVEEVLAVYAPFAMGMITNIANG
ncbi:MAG: hypothetical protein WCK28_00130 [Burkholderiales bacterium]|jgi:hypothetical protein